MWNTYTAGGHEHKPVKEGGTSKHVTIIGHGDGDAFDVLITALAGLQTPDLSLSHII